MFQAIAEDIYANRTWSLQEDTAIYEKQIKALEQKESTILSNIEKLVNYPQILEAKNKELENIQSEKYKLELKKSEKRQPIWLQKFQEYSQRLLTHTEQLALQKEKPEFIKLAFEVVFWGRITYEEINKHTPKICLFSLYREQQKNPSCEEFSLNSKWQAH